MSGEALLCVWWRDPTGAVRCGKPLPAEIAEAWAKAENDRWGSKGYLHWTAPAATSKGGVA